MSELIWLPEALLDLTEHFEFLKLKIPIAERFFPTGAIAEN
jgi:hypothetical protein